ncbi:zinc knuckle [Pyrrhoderma noxium]|uniref:Zinc knuckle n=1 Tax=Pyrrhoderma noxium TaxID=2282107 RepID=A0A286UC86_9AGAM|nr:zinc knuckle [Pyrrhoderma noxium]
MSKYAPHKPSASNPRASSSTLCQKCLQKGHFTYQCKGSRPYVSRPSRTQMLEKPGLLAKLKAEGKPSVEVPEEFKNKSGTANKILEAKEKERQKEKAAENKKRKRSRSSNSESSDSDSDSDSSSGSDSDSDSDSDSGSSDAGGGEAPPEVALGRVMIITKELGAKRSFVSCCYLRKRRNYRKGRSQRKSWRSI